MKLEFDLESVITTEFGVGSDDGKDQCFSFVPVEGKVQVVLREMSQFTWTALQELTKTPPQYEASEKYSTCERVYLPLNSNIARRMRELHTADNIDTNVQALAQVAQVFCYFARFTDIQGRRLTGLRRATQFKGVLKRRLIRLATDALRMVEDKVFKLDGDFDLLVDADTVHILRPSGFEFAGQLQEAILAAVPINIEAIKHDLGFVEFSSIEKYASYHPRAARYLASIRAQKETKNIDKTALKRLCKSTGVDIRESMGKIIVEEDNVMGFLEVMDRRRYELELVKGSPERFKASSRSKL